MRTMPPERRSAATSSICDLVSAPAIVQCFTFRTTEQLSRVHHGRLRDFLAAEHAGDLRHALFGIVETADSRACVSAGILFPYKKMRGSKAGDLRQMGN